MLKIVNLKLLKIKCTGDNIGDDIRITIECLDDSLDSNQKIKNKTEVVVNAKVGQFPTAQESFSLPLKIKIIEHDLVFDDVGGEEIKFKVDLNVNTPQIKTYEIEVKKSRSILPGKNTAVFTLTFEVLVTGQTPTVDYPKWTGDFGDDTETILLARLIFGEARNEPPQAKKWIAWAVINRVEAKAWPNTIKGVILQGGQYDPFKTSDPNYLIILDPLGFVGVDKKSKESWYECYKIAESVVLRKTSNPTTATHFHGAGVTRKWFEKHMVPHGKFLKKIGKTYFYWSLN